MSETAPTQNTKNTSTSLALKALELFARPEVAAALVILIPAVAFFCLTLSRREKKALRHFAVNCLAASNKQKSNAAENIPPIIRRAPATQQQSAAQR